MTNKLKHPGLPLKGSASFPRFIATGLCALALSACVSQGKYEQLIMERDNLAEQNEQLSKNINEKETKLSLTSEELAAIKAKKKEQEELFTKLKTELSSELDSQKLTLRQMNTGINVNLPEDILFPSGSAELRDSGREVLSKVSEQLNQTSYQVIVSGYTDNVPISGKLTKRFPSNWDLAAARATNIVRLLEQNNVPADKLIAASYGENRPVADNSTEEGRQQNRRIEIHLRPVIVETEEKTQ
ncbi:MAG: OmpA family protein [Gammaproteobacteria bacterium]|nr:OmpA family protein [Gammaproteobacteria bacterium]